MSNNIIDCPKCHKEFTALDNHNSIECLHCHKEINESALICKYCKKTTDLLCFKNKSRTVYNLLMILLGWSGAHLFYMGDKKEGRELLLWSILSCGLLLPLVHILVNLQIFANNGLIKNEYPWGKLIEYLTIVMILIYLPFLITFSLILYKKLF